MTKRNNVANISSLRNEVGEVFMQLREQEIETHEAATLAKLADTMIASSKVELEFSKVIGKTPNIEFLESKGKK